GPDKAFPAAAERQCGHGYRPGIGEVSFMVTHVDTDITQVWPAYRAEPTVELRNQLVEHYLHLVKYNAERIWSRLPDGVELDDLITPAVFGLLDATAALGLTSALHSEPACGPSSLS